MKNKNVAKLGLGLGLRDQHIDYVLKYLPNVDWFEIISENFMDNEGRGHEILKKIQEHYPLVQHGVSLSIGSCTPLDFDYLKKLKALTKITKTPWVSDHLCWGQTPGGHYHDLLPLPMTNEVINYVAQRARIVQDYLELPLALENLSSYVAFEADEMPEWEFYSRIVEKADIYFMLDINNIYVSAFNHSFDPFDYINHLDLSRVVQIHLAGHDHKGNYILDSHSSPVKHEVWKLYEYVWPKTNNASTLLEWDEKIPSFNDLWSEALKAKHYQQSINGLAHGL